jgi:hypothetical protein
VDAWPGCGRDRAGGGGRFAAPYAGLGPDRAVGPTRDHPDHKPGSAGPGGAWIGLLARAPLVSPNQDGSAFEVRLGATNSGGTAGEHSFLVMDQAPGREALPIFQATFTLPGGGYFELPFTWTPTSGPHHIFVAEQPDVGADLMVAGDAAPAASVPPSDGQVRVDTKPGASPREVDEPLPISIGDPNARA